MADKIPVIVFVDPEEETKLTIPPFADKISTAAAVAPNTTITGGATYQNGQWDGSADVD